MAINKQTKNQHLLWRSGFGPGYNQIQEISNLSSKDLFKNIMGDAAASPIAIDVTDDELKSFREETPQMIKRDADGANKFKKLQKSRDAIRSLNTKWLDEMVSSNAQLREKMAFFWHGHFACRNLNIFYQQDLLQIIRSNALGNFGDMLKAVSRSAAMLNFLNNQQNKKDHPNENFARELMELFTIGRGNYTEKDVKEAARAFTGWTAGFKGEFLIRSFQHDNGSKTIFGKTGNFGDMLKAVSRSAAMLNFLNNQQNKKDHPNENFARELMELFTIGRGNYTENDVKEAARAFTGWTAGFKGEFLIRPFQHDNGSKTIFGKTGNLGGEDVITMLLERKETARFITKKLYRFLINEQIDETRVEKLSDKFYSSGYDIATLLNEIFLSEWFYDPKNIGAKIKSPIELLVGIRRLIPMQFDNQDGLQLLQRALGQVLFFPPNVAGWPGGKTWIDSSTLLLRMRVPQLLANTDEFNVGAKDDDDVMMGMKKKDAIFKKFVSVKTDWNLYQQQFDRIARENLESQLQLLLLQTATPSFKDIIRNYADMSGRSLFIESYTLQVMSLPEYQFC